MRSNSGSGFGTIGGSTSGNAAIPMTEAHKVTPIAVRQNLGSHRRDCMAVRIPAQLICHYFAVPHSMSPADAWKALKEGNERVVKGEPRQPNQGAGRRKEASVIQNRQAVLFRCT